LQLPHAYVNCIEASTPRHIFETILNQLHGHVPTARSAPPVFPRGRRPACVCALPRRLRLVCVGARRVSRVRDPPPCSDSFAPHSKCGDMSRFIQLLSESVFPCPSAVETAPSSPARTADAAPPASPHASPPSADAATKAVELHAARVRLADGNAWSTEETRYIIFDNAERLRLMEKTVLPALLRLDQLTNRNVCCVLISHVPYENFLAAAASTPMVCVDFEPYSKAQLTDILVRSCPHADLVQGYTEMIKLILNVFLDQYRELLELEQVAATAWPLVKAALDAGELAAGSADASKMYRLLKPVLRQSAARSLCLPAAILSLEQADTPYHATGECGGDSSSSSRAAGAGGGGLLDVELPYYSKHLLVAAFLASFNPPSRDVSTFSLSSSGAMKKRKRGGRLCLCLACALCPPPPTLPVLCVTRAHHAQSLTSDHVCPCAHYGNRQGGRGKSLKDASGAPATANASADALLQAPQACVCPGCCFLRPDQTSAACPLFMLAPAPSPCCARMYVERLTFERAHTCTYRSCLRTCMPPTPGVWVGTVVGHFLHTCGRPCGCLC